MFLSFSVSKFLFIAVIALSKEGEATFSLGLKLHSVGQFSFYQGKRKSRGRIARLFWLKRARERRGVQRINFLALALVLVWLGNVMRKNPKNRFMFEYH